MIESLPSAIGAVARTQRPPPPWRCALSVGLLLELLEENYRLLLCLAPNLRGLTGAHRAPGRGADLYLDILKQARYTTLIRLTYQFPPVGASDSSAPWADPDAHLRVCHDARQVEVIRLRQQVPPLIGAEGLPTLREKWKPNWFLSKWLHYCVREDYRFFAAPSPSDATATEPSVTPD